MGIIGSDYDGTWTDHPEIRGEVDLIITGNSWQKWQEVIEELDRPDIAVMFNPLNEGEENLDNIVAHKANIINKIGVSKYYEDQETQKKVLDVLCPKCKIILVKEGRTSI